MRLPSAFFILSCLVFGTVSKAQAQVSPFDSVKISPAYEASFPWCGGRFATVVEVRYVSKPGVTYADSNIFRLEVSNKRGEFDNLAYPARFVGSIKSTATSGTITGITLVDNLTFGPVVATNAYRTRLTASDGNRASDPSAPIPALQFVNCPFTTAAPALYSTTLRPLKKFYQRGEQVSLVMYRRASRFILQPNDFIRLQLSDSNGVFDSNTLLIDSLAPAFVADSMVFNFRIPAGANVKNALRYRIRPTITSDPNMENNSSLITTTTTNGHDISIIGTPVGVSARSQGSLQVWPVPSTTTLQWQLPADAGRIVGAQLISVTGVAYNLNALPKDGNIAALPPGMYVLRVQTVNRNYSASVIKQ